MEVSTDSEILYLVSSTRTTPRQLAQSDQLMMPETDETGRVLFRTPVKKDTLNRSLASHIRLLNGLMQDVPVSEKGFEVDSITLKLGIDAEVGFVLIAEASVKASIELTIKRVGSRSAKSQETA